jgi:uncharacterized protein YjiS (DUF1127 family)
MRQCIFGGFDRPPYAYVALYEFSKTAGGPQMAFYTSSIHQDPKQPLGARCVAVLRRAAIALMATRDCSQAVQRMQQLDDRSLAAMGLRRDDIVRMAYRDLYDI